jgi:hypothetical protein
LDEPCYYRYSSYEDDPFAAVSGIKKEGRAQRHRDRDAGGPFVFFVSWCTKKWRLCVTGIISSTVFSDGRDCKIKKRKIIISQKAEAEYLLHNFKFLLWMT